MQLDRADDCQSLSSGNAAKQSSTRANSWSTVVYDCDSYWNYPQDLSYPQYTLRPAEDKSATMSSAPESSTTQPAASPAVDQQANVESSTVRDQTFDDQAIDFVPPTVHLIDIEHFHQMRNSYLQHEKKVQDRIGWLKRMNGHLKNEIKILELRTEFREVDKAKAETEKANAERGKLQAEQRVKELEGALRAVSRAVSEGGSS